jgi:CheY-like chemotaxis protein
MSKARLVAVVEDDDLFRERILEALEAEGYYALGFPKTADALAHLPRLERGAALVLLDLVMEQPDGWHMLRALKSDPHLRHLPVVVMSGVHDQEPTLKAAGIDGFLRKPFEPHELFAVVADKCARLLPRPPPGRPEKAAATG